VRWRERVGWRSTNIMRYIEVKWKINGCANYVIKNEKFNSACWLSPSLKFLSSSPPLCIRNNYIHFLLSRPVYLYKVKSEMERDSRETRERERD